jgi:probable HAF family extracellular repeat protein
MKCFIINYFPRRGKRERKRSVGALPSFRLWPKVTRAAFVGRKSSWTKEEIMPIKTFGRFAALTILAALAVPLWTAAQDNPSPDNKKKLQKYKLFDLGTFGGPSSGLTTNNGNGAGALVLNSSGTLTGSADTPVPDPFSPNCYAASCYVSHAFRWEDGVLTDLGAIPGANTSQGTAINEKGWIAGLLQNGNTDPITGFAATDSVLWKGKEMTNLGTLGGYQSLATSVNDVGEVVGFSTVPGPIDPYSFLGQSIHTYYWHNGKMQDVGTLGGPDALAAIAHELQGIVFGSSFTNNIPNPTTGVPTYHPFLWKDGHMQDLGTLGGTLCCQESVVANSRGQLASDSTLAGDLTSHPFLWDKGKLIDLGTLGGDYGFVHNLNENGDVVGYADDPVSGMNHPFLWRHGVMTDLGTLGRTSYPMAVNERVQVVGASRIDDTPGNFRATFWENGGPLIDLNTLIPQNSPLTLVWASNINDRGEIAGLGVPAGCAPADYLLCGHAFLLMPDGDCDQDNERRIAESEVRAALIQQTVPVTTGRAEPSLSPAERFRSMMRQRYHLPGQPIAPRD